MVLRYHFQDHSIGSIQQIRKFYWSYFSLSQWTDQSPLTGHHTKKQSLVIQKSMTVQDMTWKCDQKFTLGWQMESSVSSSRYHHIEEIINTILKTVSYFIIQYN